MEQDIDIHEPLKSALRPVIEKLKDAGWKILLKRPTVSNPEMKRVSIEVTSRDETLHALARFDEDDSLPAKIEELVAALSA